MYSPYPDLSPHPSRIISRTYLVLFLLWSRTLALTKIGWGPSVSSKVPPTIYSILLCLIPLPLARDTLVFLNPCPAWVSTHVGVCPRCQHVTLSGSWLVRRSASAATQSSSMPGSPSSRSRENVLPLACVYKRTI